MTNNMNLLLKTEELGQIILSLLIFNQLPFAWWWYPACILLPDISMIGYAVNTKVGAFTYNLFHHKMIAVLLIATGLWQHLPLGTFTGAILFGHSAMDRLFGYGLKYNDSFSHTHLGIIGKQSKL